MTLIDEPFAETEHFKATIVRDTYPHEPDFDSPLHRANKTRSYRSDVIYDDHGFEQAYYRVGIRAGDRGGASGPYRIPPGFRSDQDWADDSYDVIFYASRKELVDYGWGKTRPTAEQLWQNIESDAKQWVAYWNGDVYGWSVEVKGDVDNKYEDSCWGYYGDEELEYVQECAQEALDLAEETYANQETDSWRDVPELATA